MFFGKIALSCSPAQLLFLPGGLKPCSLALAESFRKSACSSCAACAFDPLPTLNFQLPTTNSRKMSTRMNFCRNSPGISTCHSNDLNYLKNEHLRKMSMRTALPANFCLPQEDEFRQLPFELSHAGSRQGKLLSRHKLGGWNAIRMNTYKKMPGGGCILAVQLQAPPPARPFNTST
jgi:hypothetical protein